MLLCGPCVNLWSSCRQLPPITSICPNMPVIIAHDIETQPFEKSHGGQFLKYGPLFPCPCRCTEPDKWKNFENKLRLAHRGTENELLTCLDTWILGRAVFTNLANPIMHCSLRHLSFCDHEFTWLGCAHVVHTMWIQRRLLGGHFDSGVSRLVT